MTGVYKITNEVNNKVYIGQSVNIATRWSEHLRRPFNQNDKNYDSYFYRSIRKYGIENFTFVILEQCSQKNLNDREQYWINFYQAFRKEFGYNLTSGGDGSQSCGRFLDTDSVNEIKKLLLHTAKTQWDIANEFCVNQAIISYINSGTYWHDDNLTDPLRKRLDKKKWFCVDCGIEISDYSTRCQKCASKANTKHKNKPSAEQLKEMLISNNGNFAAVGRIYNTTGGVIRKWCMSYQMPNHSQDYATKPTKSKTKKQTIWPVQQIDMDTNDVICEFKSGAEAERVTGATHVLDVCHGTRVSAGGYFWRQLKPELDNNISC